MVKFYILKMERNKAGLSQAEMGEKLNISKQAYSNKENGVSEFTCSQMVTIAKVFDMSLDSLFMADMEEQNEVFI